MDGILLVDKPSGWTSFDVVAKVRGILKQNGVTKPKVGHTGTLDPLATGLLVLTIGTYCKRAGEFSKLDKTYEVTMKLGETSTTGDAEGIITPSDVYQNVHMDKKVYNISYVKRVLGGFVGEIEQVPPAYSAIKVNGQRAYKLARAGKEVKLEPRKVTIYSIENVDYDYPEVKFTARVSSGTYIRSLVENIGKQLGTGAYMSNLRRTQVGKFDIKNSISMSTLTAQTIVDTLMGKVFN